MLYVGYLYGYGLRSQSRLTFSTYTFEKKLLCQRAPPNPRYIRYGMQCQIQKGNSLQALEVHAIPKAEQETYILVTELLEIVDGDYRLELVTEAEEDCGTTDSEESYESISGLEDEVINALRLTFTTTYIGPDQ